MRGEYFLWKQYTSEILQRVNQLVNFYSVYLCTTPIEITSGLGLLVSAAAFYSAYLMQKPLTGKIRLRRVRFNYVVDILCLAIPLSVSYFVYGIAIAPSEMALISLYPALSLFLKLGSLFKELVASKVDEKVMRAEMKRLTIMSGSHVKLRLETAYAKIASDQEKSMSKYFSLFTVAFNASTAIFFIIIAVLHIFVHPNNCDSMIWRNSCRNKVPFCKNFFEPKCNCASLRIVNNYNLTTLPESVVSSMTALRKFYILNSNLKYLPPNMELLTNMVDFEIGYTSLQHFDVDVSKWMMLNVIYLYYNNLQSFSQSTLWTHASVTGVAITGNPGMEILYSGLKIPSLRYLDLGENQINVRESFDVQYLKRLTSLFLGGNRIQQFPSESLKENIVYLSVPRCNLTSLPAYLSQFKLLKYLDVRDNNISNVNDDLRNLIKKNKIEAYFHGNPICANDPSLDCDPVCSNICWSKHAAGDGTCDMKCLQESCEYDGGECRE